MGRMRMKWTLLLLLLIGSMLIVQPSQGWADMMTYDVGFSADFEPNHQNVRGLLRATFDPSALPSSGSATVLFLDDPSFTAPFTATFIYGLLPPPFLPDPSLFITINAPPHTLPWLELEMYVFTPIESGAIFIDALFHNVDGAFFFTRAGTASITPVPVPPSLVLLGSGLMTLGLARRQKRSG